MYLRGEKIVTPLSKVTYMILDSLVIETATLDPPRCVPHFRFGKNWTENMRTWYKMG